MSLHKFYQIGAIITALIGVIILFIPDKYLSFNESNNIAIVVNIGYHMMYYGINYGFFGSYKYIEKSSNMVEFTLAIIKIFAYWIIIIIALASTYVLYQISKNFEFENLFIFLIFYSTVLGVLSLLKKINIELRKY